MTIINALRFAGISLVALVTTAVCGVQFAVAGSHMADDRISDVVNTKHNFSAIANPELPTNDIGVQVKAATQKEVCVFCHTPHGDPAKDGKAFLWNHKASSQSYTNYSSSSMDATVDDPGEASKMCLSCHDGTVAVGAVDVFNGQLASDQTPSSIEMSGDGQSAGLITDSGTGYNSNLGTDLRNDHPVGFAYTTTVATNDGELVDPDSADYIGRRAGSSVAAWNAQQVADGGSAGANDPVVATTRIAVPLEGSLDGFSKIDDLSAGSFASLTGGKVECTTCHDPHIRSTTNDHNIKFLRLNRFQEGQPSGGSFSINQDINCLACHKKAGWSTSAHGSFTHADEIYDDTAADTREFPRGIKVSEASCLNCHDAHTEEGARYLLREGADTSGNSAIEETCYQCHSSASILADGNAGAKDIKTLIELTNGHTLQDFSTSNDHDIIDANLSETQTSLKNSHVTCTDCHNPHRLTKNALYDNSSGKVQSTHDHSGSAMHTNLASGSLAGTFGIEPDYSGLAAFGSYDTTVITYTELKGNPTGTGDDGVVVTKEYQVCLKCHSAHGNSNIGNGAGQVPNVAAEFVNSELTVAPNVNSWHPVVGKTNRTGGQNNLLSPWNVAGAAGNQTMYCSDCHASNDATAAIGAHGSTHSKMLIANWDQNTGDGTSTDLCFSCHSYDQYANPATAVGSLQSSGFSCAAAANCKESDGATNSSYTANLHIAHSANDVNFACGQCHVKVPHGWENKALLVDKKTRATDSYYYLPNATLAIDNFRASGAWVRSASGASDDCSTSGCHTIP